MLVTSICTFGKLHGDLRGLDATCRLFLEALRVRQHTVFPKRMDPDFHVSGDKISSVSGVVYLMHEGLEAKSI